VLRLLKLVNMLLDFSRIEAGRAQATYEPTDLGRAAADISSVLRSAITKAGLTYEVNCPELDELVYVDLQMWEKIVLNLIFNALKFTAKGKIKVDLARKGNVASLTVGDTGVGIPQSELLKIFERFHRVQSTTGRTHEGAGMVWRWYRNWLSCTVAQFEWRASLAREQSLRFRSPLVPPIFPKNAWGKLAVSGTARKTGPCLRTRPWHGYHSR
jgi:light-regulated signal transduction histidine kinase (bacteriophytochrome)